MHYFSDILQCGQTDKPVRLMFVYKTVWGQRTVMLIDIVHQLVLLSLHYFNYRYLSYSYMCCVITILTDVYMSLNNEQRR